MLNRDGYTLISPKIQPLLNHRLIFYWGYSTPGILLINPKPCILSWKGKTLSQQSDKENGDV